MIRYGLSFVPFQVPICSHSLFVEDADRKRGPSATLGPLQSPAKAGISPKRSVSFKLPEDDRPAPRKKSGERPRSQSPVCSRAPPESPQVQDLTQ